MSRCEGCQLGCAVVRIVLTSFCRRLCGCKQFQPRPEYSVICIGLSGAGKSSLLAALSNEATDGLEPTAGFSVKAVGLTCAILNVHELGGNDTVRRYWSHYYSKKHALLFVVDASGSLDAIKAAALEFHSALSHPDLRTLPVLLVFNKRDLQAESDEIVEHFRLEDDSRCFITCTSSVQDVSELREKLNALSEIIQRNVDTS